MTVINDTRVVRLQRTAARTGHQHSGDQDIREQVVNELVTAADAVSLPPGSLITLQRGPGAGLTEEGSVLNADLTEIGGVQGGQTSSVIFDSEDGGATAASIFATEVDFATALGASGEYAINYKTFQVKTYDPVPVTVGSRILITYAWAPVREYLEWVPEDIEPDLEAFGDGPHQSGDFVEAGCNIDIEENEDGYKTISVDVASLAGSGLDVAMGEDGCLQLVTTGTAAAANLLEGCNINLTEIDGYTEVSVDIQSLAGAGLVAVMGDDGCEHLEFDFDGYGRVVYIRKFGSEADNHPFNSVFTLDGYEYQPGTDRLLVTIDGVLQSATYCYVERSTTSIEFVDPVDDNEVIEIRILPGALGGGFGGTTNLQNAYDNSASGAKNISLDDGQITFTQTLATGSVLRLISNSSITTGFTVDQNGTGEAARLKSVVSGKPTLLVQKDTTARNTILNTVEIDRTTSHISGGQTGIGSAILTRLENSGSNAFSASRLVTGTESATDSVEKTYLSFELSDDGVLTEHMRLTSIGRLALNTTSPDALLHVQGDGYFADEIETADKARLGTNGVNAPLNVPVFNSDPSALEHGDIWITDSGGTRQLHARISGVTYSVTLT